MVRTFFSACYDCLTLNGSGWALAYGAIILFFAIAKTSRFADESTRSEGNLASLLAANPGALSIHGMVVQQAAILLTPNNYVSLLAKLYSMLRKLTGIERRTLLGNVFVFFIFYYMIVSAPAAVMRPANYQVSYDALSLFALALMMLVNALGDIVSLRLTFRNVEKLHEIFAAESADMNAKESFRAEFRLYFTTLIDVAMALVVLFTILITTSVLFGWSIGEYGVSLSSGVLDGSWNRIENFWSTVNEPYQFAPELVPGLKFSAPMLLIFSLTTFLPTLLLLLFALAWTLLMPLRIIFHTELPALTKLLASEAVVLVLCSIVIAGLNWV